MITTWKLIFSYPDPVSERNKILEAFDNFVETNSLTYSRNDIKTIILGKRTLYYNIQCLCTKLKYRLCYDEKISCFYGWFIYVFCISECLDIKKGRKSLYTKAIILSDAFFIYQETLPEEISPDLSCTWRKICFYWMSCCSSDYYLVYHQSEYKRVIPFKDEYFTGKLVVPVPTTKIKYIMFHRLSYDLLFTEEESHIMQEVFKKYKDQLDIV
eukprot:maker-scaffold_59-snap-gene-0.102-mRNA-1 protein AED:0.30 eAED:0.88 QI:0/0/0/1/1/1/2/0/212